MSAAEMMKQIAKTSPRFKARLAGVFFMLTMLTAVFTEFIVRGRLSHAGDIAADIIEVSGMVAVTLLFYPIFKPVNASLTVLAMSFNLAALTFEAFNFSLGALASAWYFTDSMTY